MAMRLRATTFASQCWKSNNIMGPDQQKKIDIGKINTI